MGLVKIHRRIAFGDILQLIPSLNALHERGDEVVLSTVEAYQEFIGLHPAIVDLVEMEEGTPKPGWIDFDGILEQDHGGPRKHQHRTSIYLELLGLDEKSNDWSFPIPDKDLGWTKDTLGRDSERPLLAIQWNGSHPIKSLRPYLIRKLAAALYGDGFDIVLFGNRPSGILKTPEGMYDYSGGLPSYEAMHDLLTWADAAIVMDSGPLWMTHLTGTPTVAVLGPTRPQERTSRHPRATVLDTADLVRCEPCFETRNMCKATGSITCMEKLPHRRLYHEAVRALGRLGIVSNSKRLIPDLVIQGRRVEEPSQLVEVEWVGDPAPRSVSGFGKTWPGHPIKVPKQVALRLRLSSGWKVSEI